MKKYYEVNSYGIHSINFIICNSGILSGNGTAYRCDFVTKPSDNIIVSNFYVPLDCNFRSWGFESLRELSDEEVVQLIMEQ
jgi:hypothetical protein